MYIFGKQVSFPFPQNVWYFLCYNTLWSSFYCPSKPLHPWGANFPPIRSTKITPVLWEGWNFIGVLMLNVEPHVVTRIFSWWVSWWVAWQQNNVLIKIHRVTPQLIAKTNNGRSCAQLMSLYLDQVRFRFIWKICTYLLRVFNKRGYFIKGGILSKVVFHQRSSFIKGCLPWEAVFH